MAIRPMEPSGQCESELAAAGVALPELLAPAGGLDQMLAAIAAGADAIYAGLDGFNARVSAHGFSDDEFTRGCAVAHAHGVRVYVTLNVFVFDVLPALYPAPLCRTSRLCHSIGKNR